MSDRKVFCGTKNDQHITSSFTCTSANLVYCIVCLHCGELYVGETKRRLGDRFREHLNDIRKNNKNSPVAVHFNTSDHSIEDVSVSVLTQCSSDSARKVKEMRLIDRLGCLEPLGFTYNVISSAYMLLVCVY